MRHTATAQSKQRDSLTTATASTQPRREHPVPCCASTAHSNLGQPWSSAIRSSQLLAGLHETIGNQAVLRLLSHPMQRKLTINAPGDQYEQEADRVAEQVMRQPDPVFALPLGVPHSGEAGAHQRVDADQPSELLQRSPQGVSPANAAPPIVHDVLRTPGSPLDLQTRSFMETRFGHSFDNVRIHSDAKSGNSATAVNALAYTVQNHIVFGHGNFKPDTRGGLGLIAHELTHVAQQESGAEARLYRAPAAQTAAAGKFYQEVIDGLDMDRRDMARQAQSTPPMLVITPLSFEARKALLALCEALDQGRTDGITDLVNTFLGKDLVPWETLSDNLVNEIAARLIQFGFNDESSRFRQHYFEAMRAFPAMSFEDPRRERQFLSFLTDRAIALVDESSPQAIEESLKYLFTAFGVVRDALFKLDLEEVKQQQQRPSTSALDMEPFALSMFNAFSGMLKQLYTKFEEAFQALIDRVSFDFTTGKSSDTLQIAHRILEKQALPAIHPDDKHDVGGITLTLSHTTIGKGGKGRIDDAFARGRAGQARSVEVSTYDPSQEWVQELQGSLQHLYEIRTQQVEVLARIYGATELLPRELGGAREEEAQDNAAAIAMLKGGQLRLDNDDDWRAFLLQRYEDMVHPTRIPQYSLLKPTPRSPTEALHEIIDLLFAYLQAFTVHARFTNIYDVGPTSYLNRPFPRALSGQLEHDCGVYALRVAYILSLVRKELGLRFRFVLLPAHVSLVITGDGLPTYIIENNSFNEISPKEWADAQKQWEQFTDPTTHQPAPGKSDEEQFVGEMAASRFIEGPLDMPFKVSDVPKPVADAKAEQRQLWDYYQRTSTFDLFGPAAKNKNSEGYLFVKRYLALTEELRQIYNESARPFWNTEAPKAWGKFRSDVSAHTRDSSINVQDLSSALTQYQADYQKALQPLDDRYDRFENEEKDLSKKLHDIPDLVKPGVRLSAGARAATLWHFHWTTHKNQIQNYLTDLQTRPDDEEVPLTEIDDKLTPLNDTDTIRVPFFLRDGLPRLE